MSVKFLQCESCCSSWKGLAFCSQLVLHPHLRVTCWQELDYVFIVIYVVEISIRLTAYGRSCFKDGWLLGLCLMPYAYAKEVKLWLTLTLGSC